ncbi:MAG: hypothetical protein RL687_93 [Candidatus Parcubacteria bacterium]|jgi:hypothetical protein
MSQEKPKKDETKTIHGPYHSDLTINEVKKRKTKSKDSNNPKDKDLSSTDDGCGNGY